MAPLSHGGIRTPLSVTWALCALVLLVPVVYWGGLRDYTLPPKLLVFQGVQAIVLICWLRGGARELRLPPGGPAALAYLLINGLSLFYASDPVAGLLELTKIITGCFLLVLIGNRLGQDRIPSILKIWVLTAAAVSLLGIAEYWGWRPFPIPSAGLPSATLGYRNIAAMYLIQSIPLGLALLAITRSRAWTWTSSALAAALMTVFLVYTRTRGAWAGLAGAALATLILWIGRPPRVTALPHSIARP